VFVGTEEKKPEIQMENFGLTSGVQTLHALDVAKARRQGRGIDLNSMIWQLMRRRKIEIGNKLGTDVNHFRIGARSAFRC
jgi:hypothetical protein